VEERLGERAREGMKEDDVMVVRGGVGKGVVKPVNGLKNGVERLVNIMTTTVSIRLSPNGGCEIEGFDEAAEEAEMSPRRVSEEAGFLMSYSTKLPSKRSVSGN